MKFDKFFWFTQPSTILTQADNIFAYIFASLLLLSLLVWALAKFSRHAMVKKLLGRFQNLFLTIGLIGLFWFGLRYENTPLFSYRFWAGLGFALGVVWLGFILKYLIFNFRIEKQQFDHEQVKNKYIPRKR